jgi:hypothetical protein
MSECELDQQDDASTCFFWSCNHGVNRFLIITHWVRHHDQLVLRSPRVTLPFLLPDADIQA